MEFLLILSLIDIVILGGFAIFRTYVNYKSLKIQQAMLEESRKYWLSWPQRKEGMVKEQVDLIKRIQVATWIDTEGSVALLKNNNSLVPYVDFSNTSEALVKRFIRDSNAKGSFEEIKRNKRAKICYRFRIYKHNEVKQLLESITPFLIARKQQAELLLDYCDLRLINPGSRLTEKEWEIYSKLKNLNKRGARKEEEEKKCQPQALDQPT